MAPSTFFVRKSAVLDLEEKLFNAVLVAGLGGGSVVSKDGHYELKKILGRGGSAVVCRALWIKFDIDVALKLYPALEGETTPEIIRSEARSIAKLKHRNIVQVHDYGDLMLNEEIRCYYVTMELLEGDSLRKWLADAPSPVDILKVFCDAGEGLGYLHRKGCVHRDFKPENVMLVGDEPKIVDFGLAENAATRVEESSVEDSAGRRTIVGTLAFLAPEVLRGEESDPASDQFAFAAALWEALFREFPYAIDSIDPKRRSQRPQRPERAHRVSPQLLDVLYRALDADRRARFSSMQELVEGLRRAVPGFVISSTAAANGTSASSSAYLFDAVSSEAITVPIAPARPKSRRGALLLAGGIAFATVGIFGGDFVAPSQLAEHVGLDRWVDAVGGQDDKQDEDEALVEEPELAIFGLAAQDGVAHAVPDSACAAEGIIAGRWSFTTKVIWASRSSWRWPQGSYELTVEPDPNGCQVQIRVIKHSSRDEGQGHRRAAATVSLFPVAGYVGEISFEVSPSRTTASVDDFEYTFDILFAGDRLQGAFWAEREGMALFGGQLYGTREGAKLETGALPLTCVVRCTRMCIAKAALAKCREACAGGSPQTSPDCGPLPVDFHVVPKLVRATPEGCQRTAELIAGTWSAYAIAEEGDLRHYKMQLAAEGCELTASFEGLGRGPQRMRGQIYAGEIWALEGSDKGRSYRWRLAGAGPAFGDFMVSMPTRAKKRQISGGLAAYRIR